MAGSLDEMVVFTKTVATASLSAAARELGVSTAAVSRKLATLGHKHIAPLIPEFAQRFPGIQLALSLSDRAINVIDEGFDLAIRIAELQDSSLAARKLAPNPRVVCASPAYL